MQFSILPLLPLTDTNKGQAAPNGWTGWQGSTAPDGWQQTGSYFGVYRDGEMYRLRILTGWGT